MIMFYKYNFLYHKEFKDSSWKSNESQKIIKLLKKISSLDEILKESK